MVLVVKARLACAIALTTPPHTHTHPNKRTQTDRAVCQTLFASMSARGRRPRTVLYFVLFTRRQATESRVFYNLYVYP